MKKVYLSIGILATAVFVVAFAYYVRDTKAAAPSGLNATQMSSATTTVGNQQNKALFEKNSVCATRVVTTTGQAILLGFSTTSTGVWAATSTTFLNGNTGFGIWQAASTTVAYDSGLYGCENVGAFAYASSTILYQEYR